MDLLMRAAAMTFSEIAAGDRTGAAARRMSAAAWCAVLATTFAAAAASRELKRIKYSSQKES